MVVMVLGLPGSGKSYFAKHLAQNIGAIYLSSDEIREEIGKKGSYSLAAKSEVYNEVLNRMTSAIKQEQGVVLDATFYKKDLRERFINEANSNGTSVFFIMVWAKENIIKARTSIKRAKSEADFEIYLQIKGQFEPLAQPHLSLESTNTNIKEMIEKGLDYLKDLSNG